MTSPASLETDPVNPPPLSVAMRLTPIADGRWLGGVAPGWDVFGGAHGGYVHAISANAALQHTGAPDVFTITTHFNAQMQFAPVEFVTRTLGESRRFTSVLVEAWQDDRIVASTIASVGDRSGIDGPTAQHRVAPDVTYPDTRPGAGSAADSQKSTPRPGMAKQINLWIDPATTGFGRGEPSGEGLMQGILSPTGDDVTDQLLVLVAGDATPPAIWNVLGFSGWVPTVELTTHVRARPADGPLRTRAVTRSAEGGFLEEDCEVFDSAGNLVALARQLASIRHPKS